MVKNKKILFNTFGFKRQQVKNIREVRQPAGSESSLNGRAERSGSSPSQLLRARKRLTSEPLELPADTERYN